METQAKPLMASLKTICQLYDWKYDTIYKKMKEGKFVKAYRDPVGRGLRFDLKEVEAWAKQRPVEADMPSIIANQI